jgi:hypothetical protein
MSWVTQGKISGLVTKKKMMENLVLLSLGGITKTNVKNTLLSVHIPIPDIQL